MSGRQKVNRQFQKKLDHRDKTGVIATEQLSITVEDPEIVYSGTDTICVSDSNDFAGCPSNAVRIVTNDIADIQNHLGANKRILLRRGSAWSVSDAGILRDGQNFNRVTIDAYGAKGATDSRGICDNAPEITITGNGYFLDYAFTTDWRVQNISFIGSTEASIISGATDSNSLLALRLKSTGFRIPICFDEYYTNGHDQIMVVDCDLSGTAQNVVWVGSERLVLMGNYLRNNDTEHIVRIWQAFLGVISHNNLSGGVPGRHVLKFHGPTEERVSTTDDALLDHRTEYVVISDNIFGSAGAWPVAIGPQNNDNDERLRHIIVEKNRFIPGYGRQGEPAQVPLVIWAKSVTVRNNIFDGTGSTEFGRAVYVGTRALEPAPQNIQIYNNTIYKNDIAGDSHSYSGFDFDSTVNQATVSIKNNLIQFPVNGNNNIVTCNSGCSSLDYSNNLLTDNPGFTDVDNGYLQQDFSLLPDSPAISGGADVPVFDDFIGTDRPGGGSSIGAFMTPSISPSLLQGDANLDSVVNVLDIMICINHILGTSELMGEAFQNADTNSDNRIDILDVMSIVNDILEQ